MGEKLTELVDVTIENENTLVVGTPAQATCCNYFSGKHTN